MQLVVIAHNLRSAHNVGAILRSCDGFGVTACWLTGYTPYPIIPNDTRLPHIRDKLTHQIAKTALGAELTVPIVQTDDPLDAVDRLRHQGFVIAALEQSATSIMLPGYHPPKQLALLLGEEVRGVTSDLLAACDLALEIPMAGRKESFNVSVAAGIALYALTSQKD